MANLMHYLHYLTPWEFSPTVLGICFSALLLYLLGVRKIHVNGGHVCWWRHAGFLSGLVLIYVCLQSYVDYWSQHMFWVHRVQHLILHHLGPFLIALAAPDEVLTCALPASLLHPLRALLASRLINGPYRLIQNPVVACVLFVGLIYIWLTPSIHFNAMLSIFWYKFMNWSMVVDGLLFWWLVVGPEKRASGVRPGYGTRLIMLLIIIIPQIAIGAFITFHSSILYKSYAICGRAWPIAPLTDQQLGGLNTWIPPAMMSVLGFVIVVSRWMRAEESVAPRSNHLRASEG
jgi:putative membrane protein